MDLSVNGTFGHPFSKIFDDEFSLRNTYFYCIFNSPEINMWDEGNDNVQKL